MQDSKARKEKVGSPSMYVGGNPTSVCREPSLFYFGTMIIIETKTVPHMFICAEFHDTEKGMNGNCEHFKEEEQCNR